MSGGGDIREKLINFPFLAFDFCVFWGSIHKLLTKIFLVYYISATIIGIQRLAISDYHNQLIILLLYYIIIIIIIIIYNQRLAAIVEIRPRQQNKKDKNHKQKPII